EARRGHHDRRGAEEDRGGAPRPPEARRRLGGLHLPPLEAGRREGAGPRLERRLRHGLRDPSRAAGRHPGQRRAPREGDPLAEDPPAGERTLVHALAQQGRQEFPDARGHGLRAPRPALLRRGVLAEMKPLRPGLLALLALSASCAGAPPPTTTEPVGDAIRPFKIHVDESVLADLRLRLDRTRMPAAPEGAGWEMGVPT